MYEGYKMLKKALGRLKKDEKKEIEEIDDKIMANNFKLSMLLSGKLLCLQNLLKKRGFIVLEEDIRKKGLKVHKDYGFIQAFHFIYNDKYYLCSKDKFGQEKECCGWVKGEPIKEEYSHRSNGYAIKSIRYKCFVCGGVVGEKVL